MSGYTRIPNSLIEGMADLSGAEVKVALLIARDSIGWRKPSARISVATFGKRLDISRSTTLEALRGLRAKGIIEAEGKGGTVQSYWLTSAKNCTGSEVSTGTENCMDPSENLAPPVQNSGPPYKEERNSLERNLSKKTSSSPNDSDEPQQQREPERAKKPKRPCSIPSSKAEAEADPAVTRWYDTFDRQSLQEGLNEVKPYGSLLRFPSWKDTLKVLEFMDSDEDFAAWVNATRHRIELRYAESWPYFAKIAADWPSQREGEQIEEQKRLAQIEREKAWAEQRNREIIAENAKLRQQEQAVTITVEPAKQPEPFEVAKPEPARIVEIPQPKAITTPPEPVKPAEPSPEELAERAELERKMQAKAKQEKRDKLTKDLAMYREWLPQFEVKGPDDTLRKTIANMEAELAALDNTSTDDNADGEPATTPAIQPLRPANKAAISHTHKHPVRGGTRTLNGLAHIGSITDSLFTRRASA